MSLAALNNMLSLIMKKPYIERRTLISGGEISITDFKSSKDRLTLIRDNTIGVSELNTMLILH